MSMLSRYASLAAPSAAIQFVGGRTIYISASDATLTNVSLTSLSGGLASAPAANDLVIVYYGTGATSTNPIGVTTAGYTEVADLSSNDASDTRLSANYKLMGATPDTQVTVSATGATNVGGAVAIHVWRNVDPIFPLDVVSTTATGTNSVLCNPPAITPGRSGAVIVSGGAGGHSNGLRTYSSSDLSNFISSDSGVDAGSDLTIGLGSYAWTSGAFDPAAFTFSGTDSANYSWAAVTLALRPDQNQVGPILISQASTQRTTNATTLAINKPTGTREGDLMVAMMNLPGACTWTGDTGWTEVADQGASPSTRIAYKVAGASEGASYTFTSSISGRSSGTIVTYRNAAYDAVGTITSGTNPLVLSSVTASVGFSRILATAARAAASITITGPATMQTIVIDDEGNSPSRLVEQDATLLSAAGASGTRSFTMGSTTDVSGALVAIKPAASYTPYVNYITANNNQNTGINITVDVTTPASVPGNLLLLVISGINSSGTAVTFSVPAGWTSLAQASNSVTYQPSLDVYYRIADGSETASYTVTLDGNAQVFATIVNVAGNVTSAPLAGSIGTSSSTTNVEAPSVSVNASSTLLYVGVFANNNQGVVTFTPPSGMVEAFEISFNGSILDATLTVAYQENMAAGSTGIKTGTVSAAAGTNRYRAMLISVDAL